MRSLLLVVFFLTLQGCAATSGVIPTSSLDMPENHEDGRIVHRDLTKPYTKKPDEEVLRDRYKAAVVKLEKSLASNKLAEKKLEKLQAQKKPAEDKLEERNDANKNNLKPVNQTPDGKKPVLNTEKYFLIEKGTLKANVLKLLKVEKLGLVGWEAEDFKIKYSYQIRYRSTAEAFEKLLDGYPVQAQKLTDGTRRLFFTSRRAETK